VSGDGRTRGTWNVTTDLQIMNRMPAIRPMFLDRAKEREILDRLGGTAKSGLSGALVLYGEAGMGKTELLNYVTSSAPELRLFRIAGVEAEREFGFAALQRFLAPLLGELEDLPQPQSGALGAAFGLVPEAPADLFLVGLASLTLLANSASSQGLLCIVDDAQWVDPESLSALAFVGRRLRAEGIALIFGYRTVHSVSPTLAGIPDLLVAGLPEQAAIELLSSAVQGRLDPGIARRIVAETSGCPLALTELAAQLTAEQFAGTKPLSDPIPISRQLESHFYRQVETLPTMTQQFLLVAAAETSGDVQLVRKVARELGCGDDAEEAACRQRLIATEPRVEFRHPLIRSAVYAGMGLAERRRVHQALANAIDRSVEPDRWARHLAASVAGPNDGIAAELESAARRARDRGGYAAEASLLVQAAELTEGTANRSERLLRASAAALNAGATQRAHRLLMQARPGLTDPPLVAQALRTEGVLCAPSLAPGLLLQAARRFVPIDRERARECVADAFNSYFVSQHLTRDVQGADIAQVALATRSSSSEDRFADYILDGVSLLLAEGYTQAIGSLQEAGRLLRDGPLSDDEIARWYNFGTFVANVLMDDRVYAGLVERMEHVARQKGALTALRVAVLGLGFYHIRTGQFSVARASMAEAIEIGTAIGSTNEAYHQSLLAFLLAWQGDDQATRSSATELIRMGNATGAGALFSHGHRALAVLELGAGHYVAALAEADQIIRDESTGWRFQLLVLVVEAGVRSSNRMAAESALAEIEVRATATSTPWALGLLARSRALLADDATAEVLYAESIQQLQQTLVSTDLALAHLSYGEWLRRQHRGMDARTHLRIAHDMLATMGAAGFAERARVELLATGGRGLRRDVKRQTNLTPQELQIATFASRGATNPEIAAKMFLSANTIDYHLRKVFRKLDISSRRELEQALSSVKS
jgi:DNA-binding CsgD family transcriptional regulator/tetratricopeptide (TPR) repeat protein